MVGFAIPESSEVTYIATTNELNVEEVVDVKPRNWIPQRKWTSHTQRIPEPQAMNSEFREHSRKSRTVFKTDEERGEEPPARKHMTSMFSRVNTRITRNILKIRGGKALQRRTVVNSIPVMMPKTCEVEETFSRLTETRMV